MAVDCGSSCPVPSGFYGYRPNVAGNVILLVLYALLVPCTWFLGLCSRTYLFSTTLAVGLVLEILGFAGRILLHSGLQSRGYFTLSLLGTILGSIFISAASFTFLPHALQVLGDLGERPSPFKPMVAKLILCTLMAAAVGVDVVGVIYVSYEVHGVPSLGAEISTSLILVHSIYRIVELGGGLDGSLFQSEAAFMVMNGTLPLLSALLLTVFHPETAVGTAWENLFSRRKGGPSPSSLVDNNRLSHGAHHAYDLNIRTQRSPNSLHAQRTFPSSNSPSSNTLGAANGSPGLPLCPRPMNKPPSPAGPSVRPTAFIDQRYSVKSPRRLTQAKKLVDSDALW
ncbi:hypothetical protein E4U42_001668 [Claviceps africana]|uniref:Uncharacterized protein n=1 Tax=Claviceps africana TaxID=83212 RepID=A0A8K0J9L9_9HYPO|nr:hypothetical protein E4U42_001668 [Claviceps africana]